MPANEETNSNDLQESTNYLDKSVNPNCNHKLISFTLKSCIVYSFLSFFQLMHILWEKGRVLHGGWSGPSLLEALPYAEALRWMQTGWRFFKSSPAVQSIPDALLCLTAGLCCPQVVEIASLTEHLLGECDSRSKFKQCPRCCEAVAADHLPRHVQSPGCNRESTSRKSGLTGRIRGIVACVLSFVTGEIIFKLKPIWPH